MDPEILGRLIACLLGIVLGVCLSVTVFLWRKI